MNGVEGGSANNEARRSHHNALERKRQDHIRNSFTGLKDAMPNLQVYDIFSLNGL